MIHSYTLGNKHIAALALEGDAKALKLHLTTQVDSKLYPPVHAPMVENLSDGNIWTRFQHHLYDAFVRWPEDALNRQPYYKLWKRRSEAAMYEGLRRQGIETSLDGIAPFRVPERTTGPVPDRDLSPGDLAPRPATGDTNGYLYHLGPAEDIDSYRATGLETRATGDIPSWLGPPELSEGRLFFADSIDRARELVWRPGDNIAFRVKASDVGDVIPEQSFSGSQWAKKGIPPEKIEVLNGHGEWVPLTSAGKMLPSGLRDFSVNGDTLFSINRSSHRAA